ncbi:hypothetical protein CBER1_02761 [Cercospora berteroae]|uniref:Uncharacterized protein n=1 Tax=Cercospora berteroae TaxID=357750 RepID=A0A2S6C6U5_9PEZI|nr:hypothetical protein CBER1_02761 [Cercospora berteroae]
MAASGGTTHATTSVPDNTRVHGAASDLRKRVAIPKILGVFPKSAKKSTRSITSLLEGSTEDDTSECAQYQGPPIGYSSVDVVHEDGYKEVVGSLYAPRPRFETVGCRRTVCGHCYKVQYQPESESVADNESDDLPPWAFKPGPTAPGVTHTLHHLGYLHFPTKLPSLLGLAVTPAPTQAAAPLPQTPQHQHHRHHQSNSLSATAPTFIPSSSSSTSTPSTAHVKAQLAAREAAAKAIIAAVYNNNNHTPPSSDSKKPTIPTGPANSAYGSRFNHSTGLVFGPKSIDLRSSAQKSNDRKNRTRVVSGAPPTAPAAMREASNASSPSVDGGGFVAAVGSPLFSGESSPRIGGEAGGSQKRIRRGKRNGNGNVTFGVERQEFWVR